MPPHVISALSTRSLRVVGLAGLAIKVKYHTAGPGASAFDNLGGVISETGPRGVRR